jgi:hypothetical protein
MVLVVIVVIAGGVLFWYYESNRTQFHYEEWHPEPSRRILMYIRDLKDANLTISFVNDTTLMCRVDVDLYDPQSGSVRLVREVANQINLESTGRQKRVEVVLGTSDRYNIHIQNGENLNTTVRYGNGAVLNETWFSAHQTGIIRIAVDEDDGLTTHGGMAIDAIIPRGSQGQLHVLLDIDLPEGYDGELLTNNAPISFVERVGWGYYGNGVFATAGTMEDPWIGIGCICTSILARLID